MSKITIESIKQKSEVYYKRDDIRGLVEFLETKPTIQQLLDAKKKYNDPFLHRGISKALTGLEDLL